MPDDTGCKMPIVANGKKCVKMVKAAARNSCDIRRRSRAEEYTISDEDIMRGLSKESKNELYFTRKLRVILVLTLEQ